ncbi:MAG TPA: hypothetical protein VF627_08750, partial [Abditibacterium sp.]
ASAAVFALAVAGCGRGAPKPIWDVPALIGQPSDIVTQRLGAPQALKTDAARAEAIWRRDDVSLSANWKTGSKRVTGWTLISRDNDHAVREESRGELLVPGQLKENDPRYNLEWIEDTQRPLFYTGVKVIPAPKTHAVTIRVTASEALLDVSYSAGAAGSETFSTIAPWEKSFTLPDDSQISLSSTLTKNLQPGSFNMKVEIIADGRVIAQAASTGVPISCAADL